MHFHGIKAMNYTPELMVGSCIKRLCLPWKVSAQKCGPFRGTSPHTWANSFQTCKPCEKMQTLAFEPHVQEYGDDEPLFTFEDVRRSSEKR